MGNTYMLRLYLISLSRKVYHIAVLSKNKNYNSHAMSCVSFLVYFLKFTPLWGGMYEGRCNYMLPIYYPIFGQMDIASINVCLKTVKTRGLCRK